MKVTVIDYGLSNLLSVQHAFAHFGAEVQVTSSPADVLAADALVLPGVGAFQDGMQGLEQLGLIEPIKQKTAQGTLLLGICTLSVCRPDAAPASHILAAALMAAHFPSSNLDL